MKFGIHIGFALIVVLSLSSPAPSQRTTVGPASPAVETVNGNPSGVSFTIRTADGRAKYRQGEVITIEMLFTSSLPDTYRLDARTYDRSGHLEADTYHVEPEAGTSEPLKDYLNGMFGGSMGGLVPGPPTLETKPYVIAQTLNEFVRLDQPGVYKLYVTNERVGKPDPARSFGFRETFKSTSNTIQLEILPADNKWKKQQLQEALTKIDSGQETERGAACRTLRFLNTTDAEAEMISRFRGAGCDGDFRFGLLSSPRRQSVIDQMEARLAAPDHPVTSSFSYTLATLLFLDQFSGQTLPRYSAVQGDEQRAKQLQAQYRQRWDSFQGVIMQVAEQLMAATPRKAQSARAVSLETLLQIQANIPRRNRTAASDVQKTQTAAMLRAVFLELPAYTQNTLLDSHSWKGIASPEMLPALRQLIEKPPRSREGGIESTLVVAALHRLYELAPEEGRNAVLKEMRRSPLRVNSAALRILPDETLPEFDEILSEKLASANEDKQFDILSRHADLIARYATSASLPMVRKVLGDRLGKNDCTTDARLLAYFVRVDPAVSSELLAETPCMRKQLGTLSNIYMSKAIEAAAIENLDDPNPSVVIQAAGVLRQHGTSDDEQVLWNRLQRWHDEWQGHDPAELQSPAKNEDETWPSPAQVGAELARAIACGRGWLMTEEKFKRLQELSLTPQSSQDLSMLKHQFEERQISISTYFPDGSRHFRVAQYEFESLADFKEKLTQFAKGTAFTANSFFIDPADEPLFAEVGSFLNQNGMKLTRLESDYD